MKAILLGLWMVLAVDGSAQSLVTLTGRVTDEEGKVLTGVTVKALQGKTIAQVTHTDEEGYFQFLLFPGLYDLDCQCISFADLCLTGVSIQRSSSNLSSIQMIELPLRWCPPIFLCSPISPNPIENEGTTWRSDQINHMF